MSGNAIDLCLETGFKKANKEVSDYLSGLNDTNILGAATDEEFKKKMKLLKRKIVAYFLLEVSKSADNKLYGFIDIGYDEKDIKDSKLEQDYYWKRFMLGASRGVQNNFLGSAIESFMGVWKTQFEADKWKLDVWDASQAGQLLISDNGDATVHINSAGDQPQLEQEKDANFGNEKRLWKLVLGFKNI